MTIEMEAVGGGDGEQIEFAEEIEIHERAVDCMEIA